MGILALARIGVPSTVEAPTLRSFVNPLACWRTLPLFLLRPSRFTTLNDFFTTRPRCTTCYVVSVHLMTYFCDDYFRVAPNKAMVLWTHGRKRFFGGLT